MCQYEPDHVVILDRWDLWKQQIKGRQDTSNRLTIFQQKLVCLVQLGLWFASEAVNRVWQLYGSSEFKV